MKRLILSRETIVALSEGQTMHVEGGMRYTDSPKCGDMSVSICITNCGCKWILSHAASC